MTVTGDPTAPAAVDAAPARTLRRDNRRRKRAATAVFAIALCGFAAFAALRLVVSGVLDTDGNRYTAAALALSPYAVLVGGLLAATALLARRRLTGTVAVVLTIALAVPLAPRVLADEQPAASGATIRVLALNLYYGSADAAEIVDLVREREIDVLVLLELGTAAASALDNAGLDEVMPHRVFEPADVAVGSGIASRYPLRELALTGPSWFAQPSARVSVGDTDVEVVAVHPIPPVTRVDDWQQELRGMPAARQDGPVRILAGDFNATLDHAELRRVVDSGYVDAAEQTGDGLRPTWPRRRTAPPVTLDHVLVDERAAVRDVDVIDVDGSDHRAVAATITLPG